MISTPTGILFDGYSYDPAAQCNPGVFDETVSVVATNSLFETTFAPGFSNWQNAIWWFFARYPRTKIPEDFDEFEATLQPWLDAFLSNAQGAVSNHVRDGVVKWPKPRQDKPADRYQDWMYFMFSWVGYRRTLTLVLPSVSEGTPKVALSLVAALESPPPVGTDDVAPGRMFHIGVITHTPIASEWWRSLNTPVTV